MLKFPLTETKKTEEEKLGVGVGEEQARCLGHVNFEVPVVNPNGSVDLDMQVWSSGERSRLEIEIKSHQCVKEYL